MFLDCRLRFATIRDLYTAFPTACVDVGVEGDDEPSEAFVRRLLAEGDARAALSYCAYLLARRDAISWACRCLRQCALSRQEDVQCLDAAENWSKQPSEELRLHALKLGVRGSSASAAAWVAKAAGWSGGNISMSAQYMMEPSPQSVPQAVRGGLLIALARLPAGCREKLEVEWVDMGLGYANGDHARE